MAVKSFNKFPDWFRLIDGTHLNNLFTGVMSMGSIVVTGLTNTGNLKLGSQGGKVSASQQIALAVTAVTNTDLTATLPAGATIVSMTVYTTTAFTAVTDAMISIGNVAAGAQYVAAVSIKALGVYDLTLVAAAAAALASFPSGSPNLFIRIAQSGGSTAVGAATLVVNYIVP